MFCGAKLAELRQQLLPPVSLRLGHGAALTIHRMVIHSRAAASLPSGGEAIFDGIKKHSHSKAENFHNAMAVRYAKTNSFFRKISSKGATFCVSKTRRVKDLYLTQVWGTRLYKDGFPTFIFMIYSSSKIVSVSTVVS